MPEPVDFVEPAGEGVARVSCGLVAVLLAPDPLLPMLLRPLLLLLLASLLPPLVAGGSVAGSAGAAVFLTIHAFFNLCT